MKFEVVEKPNDWTKEIKRNISNSPILQARYDYWSAFNEYAYKKVAFAKAFNKRKASTDHWMTLSVGSSACCISLSQIRKYDHIIVEWYISNDKELYHKFHDNKSAIESEMGVQLEWNELPEKKASRILVYKTVNFENKEDWSSQFDWMMEMALRMKTVFKRYL